jgi:hypothetical protein
MHNQELRDLYSSINLNKGNTSSRMIQVEYAANING